MLKNLFFASVVVVAPVAVQAQAVTFTNAQFSTSALATAEGQTNGSSAGNPSMALPISSTATAAGLNDFSNAAAVAASGLLTATAYADSLLGPSSAQAYSRFVGSFAGGGAFRLTLDLNTFETLSGGQGAGNLFVLLTTTVGSATTTLFNNVIASTGNYVLQYALASNSTTQISLFLTDDAATYAGGQTAQSFAQVGYAATLAVPEPSTWLLFGVGAGITGLTLWRRRASSQS